MAQTRRTRTPQIEIEDRSEYAAEAIKRLAKLAVLVGIPADSDHPRLNEKRAEAGPQKRQDDPIGNAALGYIHEHGSPMNNIPPRPWLGPGVRESRNNWEPRLRMAGKAAFEGKKQEMDEAMNAAGIAAVSGVKVRIVMGLKPDLAQSTIDARRRRTPSRQAMTKEDVTPLVDTGQMLNSISYVIKGNE